MNTEKSTGRHSSIISFLLALLFSPLFISCITDKEAPAVSLETGERCPTFSAVLTDGSVFYSGRINRPTLLVFFNTSCGDCRAELSVIQQFYDDFSPQSVDVVCIARDQNRESVLQYWNENNLTLPVSPQNDDTIYKMFATSGIPRIYLIDSSRIIRYIGTDKPTPTYSDLVDALRNI